MSNMINCLAFRRMAQADPHHISHEAQAHEALCASCHQFLVHMRQVDEALAETLDKLPVPEGLNERILMATSKQQHTPWQTWALAASVVLGLALSITLPLLRTDAGLARAALAHVEEELDHLTAHQQVTQPSVASALELIGAKLNGNIGEVTYLGSCPLPGGEGKHLVITSPYGRYSLILMPAQIQRRSTAEDGMHAAIAKPARKGTYAIVASATPDLIKIEKMLDQNIRW